MQYMIVNEVIDWFFLLYPEFEWSPPVQNFG